MAKVNWKFNLMLHALAVMMFCLVSPLIMGVENLNPIQTAQVLELYISLSGIILCVPLFIPDEDKNIRDLILSKKESVLLVHGIRIMEALLALMIFVGGFLFYLRMQECDFSFLTYYYGTMATCIFIGGLGVLVYSILDNLPAAYMVPLLYYIMCYGSGKKYFGKFYLFSMMRGSVEEKKYLLIAGLCMVAVGILVRSPWKKIIMQLLG